MSDPLLKMVACVEKDENSPPVDAPPPSGYWATDETQFPAMSDDYTTSDGEDHDELAPPFLTRTQLADLVRYASKVYAVRGGRRRNSNEFKTGNAEAIRLKNHWSRFRGHVDAIFAGETRAWAKACGGALAFQSCPRSATTHWVEFQPNPFAEILDSGLPDRAKLDAPWRPPVYEVADPACDRVESGGACLYAVNTEDLPDVAALVAIASMPTRIVGVATGTGGTEDAFWSGTVEGVNAYVQSLAD